MTDYTFTGLWPQTEGNPLVQWQWQGASPTAAILHQWNTSFVDTRMGSPMRCEDDGLIYHLDLNADGNRVISVVSVPDPYQRGSRITPETI